MRIRAICMLMVVGATCTCPGHQRTALVRVSAIKQAKPHSSIPPWCILHDRTHAPTSGGSSYPIQMIFNRKSKVGSIVSDFFCYIVSGTVKLLWHLLAYCYSVRLHYIAELSHNALIIQWTSGPTYICVDKLLLLG